MINYSVCPVMANTGEKKKQIRKHGEGIEHDKKVLFCIARP